MEKIGLEAYFDDKEFQAGLQQYLAGLTKANTATEKTATSVTQSASKWRTLGDTVDRSGRQAMIGMRSIGEMANLAGVNAGFSQTIFMAAGAADAVGDLSGAFAMLNPALLAITAIGAGAALIFTQMQADAKAAAEEVAKIREPFVETRKEIESLTKLKGLDVMARELGVTGEALREYLSKTRDTANNAYIFSRAQEEIAVKSKALAAAEKDLASVQAELGNATGPLTAHQLVLQQRMQALTGQVRDLTQELGILNTAQAESQVTLTANVNQQQITTLQEGLAKAVAEGADKIKKIESDLGDDRTRIWASAASSIASIQSGLTRTLAGYDRDYARTLAGFARDEVKIATDAAHAIADAEKDAAKEMADVERDRAKSIERVNFDEATSLAQVDRDLNKALRRSRSAVERRQLRQDAADRKADIQAAAEQRRKDINDQAAERQREIQERKQERLAEIEEQRQERKAELAERRKLAEEELKQRKQDAIDAAAAQKKQAEESAAAQVKEAEKRAEKEKEIVRDELDDMGADVNRKIKELGGSVAADGTALGEMMINAMVTEIENGTAPVTAAIQKVIDDALKAAQTKYVPSVPYTGKEYDEGGYVPYTQFAKIHAGEYVLNRDQARVLAPLLASGGTTNNYYNFTHTWNGSASSFDRHEIQAMVERTTYESMARVLRSG